MGNVKSAPSSPASPRGSTRSLLAQREERSSRSLASSASSGSSSSYQSPSKKDDRKNKKEVAKAQKAFAKYLVLRSDSVAVETVDLEKLITETNCLHNIIRREEDKLWIQLILAWKLLGGGTDAQSRYSDDDMKEAEGAFPSSLFFEGLNNLGLSTPNEVGEYLLSIHKVFKNFDSQNEEHKFKEFYRFCFYSGLQESRKTLSVDVAVYLWRALLADRFPLTALWISFLQKNPKPITRDTWNVFLDFVDLVRNAGSYDSDGAWPTVVDEFAEYCAKEIGSDTLAGLCVRKVAKLVHEGKLVMDSKTMKSLPDEVREMISHYMRIVGWSK